MPGRKVQIGPYTRPRGGEPPHLSRGGGAAAGGLAAEIETMALPTRLGKKFGGPLGPLVGPKGLQ